MMPCKVFPVLLASPTLFASISAAFTVHISNRRATAYVARKAIIYSPSWDDDKGGQIISFDDDTSPYAPLFSEESNEHKDLAESISQGYVGALCRLAVAYSPPERALKLSDIETVHVLGVDESQIKIEAVLCENEGCVSLAIPVNFPEPCKKSRDQGELQNCVFGNIDALDVKASEKLHEMLLEDVNFEDIQAASRQRMKLKNTEDVELPTWWVKPTAETAEECAFLRGLLNEDDFVKDIIALASKTISQLLEENYKMDQAAVAAVGPAGMILRAVYREQLHDSDDETPGVEVVDIPVRFETVATDVPSLRSSVLGCIETEG